MCIIFITFFTHLCFNIFILIPAFATNCFRCHFTSHLSDNLHSQFPLIRSSKFCSPGSPIGSDIYHHKLTLYQWRRLKWVSILKTFRGRMTRKLLFTKRQGQRGIKKRMKNIVDYRIYKSLLKHETRSFYEDIAACF